MEANKTIIPAGTLEWEEARLGKFTASCASFLIKNPRTKAAREAGELAETTKSYIIENLSEEDTGYTNNFSTPSTDWGIMQESEAAEHIEKVYGLKLQPGGFIPYGEEAGATPDRFILTNGQVQIKCPDKAANHYKYLLIRNQEELKKVESDYYWQMQFELMCSGKSWALFASYCKFASERLKLKTLVIKPNAEDIAFLNDRLNKAIDFKNLLRLEYALNKPAKLPENIPLLGEEDAGRPGSVWEEL